MKKSKYNLEKIISEKDWYYKNSNITSANFPVPEIIETKNPQIIKIKKYTSSEDCLALIKSKGFRPANIYELAIFANECLEQFPDNTVSSFIAFGTKYIDSDGRHRVPYVYRYSDGDWGFNLGCFEFGWDSGHCLLCFCDQTLNPQTLNAPESFDSLTLESRVARLEKIVAGVAELLK